MSGNIKKITITVGKFGEEVKTVKVPSNATVEDVLSEAGIVVSTSEKIWLGGELTKLSKNALKDGSILNIVGSREGGI